MNEEQNEYSKKIGTMFVKGLRRSLSPLLVSPESNEDESIDLSLQFRDAYFSLMSLISSVEVLASEEVITGDTQNILTDDLLTIEAFFSDVRNLDPLSKDDGGSKHK